MKIVFNAATAPYGEVVDSLADVFRVGLTLEGALKDGFQLTDILALLPLEPVVREVINDAPEFLRQFVALTPETAVKAVNEARARVIAENAGKPIGKVGNAIFDFLLEIALTYGFVKVTATEGVARFEAWKALVGDLKPDEPEA